VGKYNDISWSTHARAAAKNASVLIIEGTRVGREDGVEITEHDVYEKCRTAVESILGLVVADFGARNFERLDTFMEIANKTGRQLVVTAKDAYMIHALSCVDGTCRMDQNLLVYKELKSRVRDKWETEVVLEKWGAKYISPETVQKNPDKMILCFSLFDLKHLLDIKPESGGYVYSSSEAYTEEQEIDFIRLNEWLNFFEIEPYGFKMQEKDGELRPFFEKEYHASGHLSTNDLHETITEIDPDKLIPIHTEQSSWFNQFTSKVNINGNKPILF
jgi:ribonuclease J